MVQMITAIFEDGILKPMHKLNLTTHQVVRLILLTPRRNGGEAWLPAEVMGKKPYYAVSWQEFFATKLKWQKKGPLDLSEVSIDALWL